MQSISCLKNLSFQKYIHDLQFGSLPETLEKDRKTLILDLDETLIHADFDEMYSGHDHTIEFNYNGETVSVPILVRPHLHEFLEKVSEIFELVIFTASKKEYADAVLNYLDPENKYFKQRLYRENCISIKNKIYIKDLRIFTNRQLENIVILDNSMYSFANQLSNGVLINSFYYDKSDKELLNAFAYLTNYLLPADDVRAINEKIFNFTTILDHFTYNKDKCQKKSKEV